MVIHLKMERYACDRSALFSKAWDVDVLITNCPSLVIVEIWRCLNGDAPPNIQHRGQKVSLMLVFVFMLVTSCLRLPIGTLLCLLSVCLHLLSRSYKVRFNSVSSYSDTRKSSSDEPEARINFESTGPLANVR